MVHILCFDITQVQPGGYERLYAQASPERKKRADRYLRREDKVCCVAADALLRRAVWQALSMEKFTVAEDPFGKPFLKDIENFHFNISHSGHWVVLAYGNSPVGVDVQQMRMDPGKEKVACRYFTADEREYIFCAEGGLRAERFFQIWTAKESYLKYLGTGLRRPLNSFSVLRGESDLGVRMCGTCLDDCWMTTCSREESDGIALLTMQQLLDCKE